MFFSKFVGFFFGPPKYQFFSRCDTAAYAVDAPTYCSISDRPIQL